VQVLYGCPHDTIDLFTASVWYGLDTCTGQPVAIKVEPIPGNSLRREIEFYQRIGPTEGVIKMHASGKACGYRYLVLDFVEADLATFSQDVGFLFTPGIVCNMGALMVLSSFHIYSIKWPN